MFPPPDRTAQHPGNRPAGRRRAPGPSRPAEPATDQRSRRRGPPRLSAPKLRKHGPKGARKLWPSRRCARQIHRQILRSPRHGRRKRGPRRHLINRYSLNHGQQISRPPRQRQGSVCGSGPWTSGGNRPRSMGKSPPHQSAGSRPRSAITGNLPLPPAAPLLLRQPLLLKINPSIHPSRNGPGPPPF